MGDWRNWLLYLLGSLGGLSAAVPGHATPAEWEALDALHGALTREELEARLDGIYAPHADWRSWIELTATHAWIEMDAKRPHHFYRLALRDPAVPESAEPRPALLDRPLDTWKIAIDPGHLGGEWGPMERRSFRLGDQPVVQEGDLVLAAARRLAEGLRGYGAEVVLIRDEEKPVTPERPDDFYLEAFRELVGGERLPEMSDVRERAEGLFYRQSEIRARAAKVNEEIQPDLVIALHIDAGPWANPDVLTPVEKNAGHILVNGAYMSAELRREDMRHVMLWRLLQGYSEVEVPLAVSMAESMVATTGLPPVTYHGKNASPAGNPYVWARNLLANRIYEAPVVYLEPWMLNNAAVYRWAVHGDYEGERTIDGELRASLPSVYAKFVLEGLLKALK